MKNYCDICIKSNDTETCFTSEQYDDCEKIKECFGYNPSKKWKDLPKTIDV